MKKSTSLRVSISIVIFFVTFSTLVRASNAKIDCKDIGCLHKNFNSCSDDSSTCFQVLNAQLKKAKGCKKSQDSKNFLLTVKFLGENVEASEYMSEEIENFFIEKPKCLLDGALLLDSETQREVMRRVINPHMVEDGKAKIEKNISKFQQDKRYKALFMELKNK